MSSLTHIFGDMDHPKIECAADEPCIWIRGRNDTVSLTLNRVQRQKLRAALDECDEMEAPVVTVGVTLGHGYKGIADVRWINTVFEGDAPDGYENWIEWALSRNYANVFVRAATPADFDVKIVGRVQIDEDARRLRTISDDMRGVP